MFNYLIGILALVLIWAIHGIYIDYKRRKQEKKDKCEFCLIDFAGGRVNLK